MYANRINHYVHIGLEKGSIRKSECHNKSKKLWAPAIHLVQDLAPFTLIVLHMVLWMTINPTPFSVQTWTSFPNSFLLLFTNQFTFYYYCFLINHTFPMNSKFKIKTKIICWKIFLSIHTYIHTYISKWNDVKTHTSW